MRIRTLRLRKGLASRMFEALVLAALGRAHGMDDDMCGIVISSRVEEDVLSVWSPHKDREGTLRLQRGIIMTLALAPNAALEYKRHGNYVPPLREGAGTDVSIKYDVATLKDIGAAQPTNTPPAAYVWENIDAYMGVRQLGAGGGGSGQAGKEGDDGWEQVGASQPGGGDWGAPRGGGYVRGGGRGGFRGGGRGGAISGMPAGKGGRGGGATGVPGPFRESDQSLWD